MNRAIDKFFMFIANMIEGGGQIASRLEPSHWGILAGVAIVGGLMLMKGNSIRKY